MVRLHCSNDHAQIIGFYQPALCLGSIPDQHRWPAAVPSGSGLASVRAVERQAATQEEQSRSERPDVIEEGSRLGPREHTRYGVPMQRAPVQPRPELRTVRGIAPHEPVPRPDESALGPLVGRARPRLRVARAGVEVERPESIEQPLWRDPRVGGDLRARV